MAVFQPLYFGGGQYTPDLDRKLISSVVGVDSSGNRLFGVVPEDITNASMKASISGGSLSVTTGMCIVSEDATENSTSGGYIAGIYNTAETYTPANNSTGNQVTDYLYAVVDPTQWTISSVQKTAATSSPSPSTTVQIVTSSAHGFVSGRTAVITGLGALFDGAYVITVVNSTTFTYNLSVNLGTDGSPVTVSASAYKGTAAKIITAKALVGGVARLTSASHGFSNGDAITIVGVDSTFDGTYKVQNVATNTFDYVINKVVADVASYASPTSVSTSSIAKASTPFYLAAERGSGTTLSSKSKILLATYKVNTGGATPIDLADKRKFTSSLGGTVLYTTDGGAPTSSSGRFRYNVDSNVLEHYNGTTWIAPIELASSPTDTTSTKASRGDHTHSGFSLVEHTHSYELLPHGATSPTESYQHVLTDLTDYDEGTYGEPTFFTPVSKGNYTNTLSITGTDYSNSFTSDIIQVTVNTSTDCRVLVVYSAKIDSISSPTGYDIFASVAPRLQSSSGASGTVLVSEEPSVGTASHQMGAIDGTAWSYGSEAWGGRNSSGNYTGGFPYINGTRVFNLTAGQKYFHLRFRVYTSSGVPATVVFSNPNIKVIPLTAI